MKKLSRRRLIAGASAGAATAATAGVLNVAPVLAAPSAAAPLTASGPFVAYVSDAASGTITFILDSQMITRRDPDLVARLVKGMK